MSVRENDLSVKPPEVESPPKPPQSTNDHGAAAAWLDALLRPCLPRADGLRVEVESSDHNAVYLVIHLPAADRGLVIGRGGQTVSALHRLVRMYGAQRHINYAIRIYTERSNERNGNGYDYQR